MIGIDINQSYLDTTTKRFQNRFESLDPLLLDIPKNAQNSVDHVQLIWAALIVEYIGTGSALLFARNNLSDKGHLIVTTQSNHYATSVSPTEIESVKKIGQVFQPVNSDRLRLCGEELGFSLLS